MSARAAQHGDTPPLRCEAKALALRVRRQCCLAAGNQPSHQSTAGTAEIIERATNARAASTGGGRWWQGVSRHERLFDGHLGAAVLDQLHYKRANKPSIFPAPPPLPPLPPLPIASLAPQTHHLPIAPHPTAAGAESAAGVKQRRRQG